MQEELGLIFNSCTDSYYFTDHLSPTIHAQDQLEQAIRDIGRFEAVPFLFFMGREIRVEISMYKIIHHIFLSK